MVRTSVILAFLLLLWGCSKHTGSLREGDLLFQTSAGSVMGSAVVDATGTGAGVDFDHVGIYTERRGKPEVIEAAPGKGVVVTPLDEFMEGTVVVARRVVADGVDPKGASLRALERVGLGYDWAFEADNNLYYCSELVQDCYLRDDGSRLFPYIDMNFLDSSGVLPRFWADLFSRLGIAVPQGAPGTNPNQLFAHPSLSEIRIHPK